MHKGLLIIAGFGLICLVIQLLAVISVPLTGHAIGYSLYLARNNNIVFGVFGVCDQARQTCSQPRIGYPSTGDLLNTGNGGDAVELPSKARYSISKLLVVHVVAFGVSCLFIIITAVYLLIQCREDFVDKWHRYRNVKETNAEETSDSGDRAATLKPYISNPLSVTSKDIDITGLLNFQLMLGLLACLSTLLALLADILLFMPNLSYLGWMQIIPLIVYAVISTMVCYMRRSISSRRYLNEHNFYENDDMRSRHIDVAHSNNSSDDGFYVYTNGFYSNYNDTRGEHNNSQQSNANSWRRHTPYEGDDVALNSDEVNGILDRIPMRNLTNSQ